MVEKGPEPEKRVANRFIKDDSIPDVDKDAMARDFLETFNFIYDYQSSRVGKHVKRIEKMFQLDPLSFNETRIMDRIKMEEMKA